MGKKTTTSFIHLIVNGSKCSTLKERISTKKEMIMANFYRGAEYSPKNVEDNALQGSFIYRGVKYNETQVELNQRQREGIYRGQKWSS